MKVSEASLAKMKARIRELTRIRSGESSRAMMGKLKSYLRGWYGYYGIVDAKYAIKQAECWMRRRIRALAWRRWRTPKNRYRKLIALGASRSQSKKAAGSGRGCWRCSQLLAVNHALSNTFFTQKLGLPTLETYLVGRKAKTKRETQ